MQNLKQYVNEILKDHTTSVFLALNLMGKNFG